MDIPLQDIQMMSEAEMKTILYEFNNTTDEYSYQMTVHEIFEQKVKENPSENAIVYKEMTLTYSELDARANQLARTLRKRECKEIALLDLLQSLP